MSPKGDLLMILDEESWMNVRRFRALHERGVPLAEIARECRCDWRTVKKYLAQDGLVSPPRAPSRAGTQPRLIDPFVSVVEAWLRADITMKGAVVHERLVAEYGFTGSYQRVKEYLATERPRLAAELAVGDENPLIGLHRRFEVVPGAQAQVDWGEEGDLLAHVGIGHVYSFHMTLSHSRDPFTCFTTSMDLATFWDCHRRAFAHFGGVPGAIVYDRTKTVVKRHVAPGAAVPLHPEAAAFADHYGFAIDVLAAYRPTGKGRVESRQMVIFGVHVHVGVRSAPKVWPLVNALLAYHPHLTALTASSPYWNGEDTGYASNRTMLFQQLPTAGLPFQFATWTAYRSYLRDVIATGVINEPSELRWDIRPSLRLGTIEVRACDGLADLRDVGAIAALIHCLTRYLEDQLDAGRLPAPLPPWHVQENKWRAARYGLEAIVITDAHNTEALVTDHLRELLDRLTPYAAQHACGDELAAIERLLTHGPGYVRQREAAAREGLRGAVRAQIVH